jgi:GAF domain-containing protein
MLAEGHRLEIGGSSMIGQCVATRNARIALDVGQEAVRFDNPHLPETRSELALPLTSRGAIVGALTIQSAQESAFSEEDITVLQIMADQLANAISNARLFEQSQIALQEMEAIQRRYLQQAWSEYTHARQIEGYEHTGIEMIPLGGQVPPGARRALAERRPVIWSDDGDGGASVLIVPVLLRDRPLGVLGFRGEAGRQWVDEDVALAEAISQQFSQAAEALRLLDVTQRGAARERLVGEVTARIRESLDLETVLRTATDEMRQALGLEDLVIRLVPPETEDRPT